MPKVSTTETPWLVGNEEFMGWMRDNGTDPFLTRSINLSEDFSSMDVEEFKLNSEGKKYLEDGDVATITRKVSIKVPFPMRFLQPPTETKD